MYLLVFNTAKMSGNYKCKLLHKIFITNSARTNRNIQCTGFHTTTDVRSGSNPVYKYMRERELSNDTSLSEIKRLMSKMERLYGKKNFNMEVMCADPLNNNPKDSFILLAQRYPKDSYTTNGTINSSLIVCDTYIDYIRDLKLSRLEKVNENRKLVSNKKLLSTVQDMHDNKDLAKLQSFIEDNFDSIINSVEDSSELLEFVEYLYLLNVNIRADHSCKLAKRLLKSLQSLDTAESIKLAIVLKSYSGNSMFKYVLCALDTHLERNIDKIKTLPDNDVIDLFTPLSIVQFNNYNFWSIFNNRSFVDHITKNTSSISFNTQGSLLIILSLLNQSKHSAEIMRNLTENLDKLSNYVLLNVANKSASLDDNTFNEYVYKELIKRITSIHANHTSSLYIKYNSVLPKEISNELLSHLGRLVKSVSGEILFELYCCYLKNNVCNSRQTRLYEFHIKHNFRLLTSRNISNILMYLSINGKGKSRLYDALLRRFVHLKQNHNITHNELLDIILSMSLVGLHTNRVWSGVDMANLVYRIPKNILVYLGYSFLITNVNNCMLWQILVNRILYENRHSTSEIYEVLKSAEILDFISKNNDKLNINFSKLDTLLQNSKPLHLNKLSKQRYNTAIPYDEIFNKIGLRYKRDVLINELYEAPYILTEFNIIIEPTQNPIKHVTSDMTVGEVQLRHRVLKKLNYKPYSFHDSIWNNYMSDGDDGNMWNIDQMAEFFCESVRLWHLSPQKGRGRLPLLKSNNTNKLLQTHHSNRIKKLQNLLIPQRL